MNGVKGSTAVTYARGSSPGRRQVTTRATSDRHSATALSLKRMSIRLATWNVRTLYQSGKVQNVIQEMHRVNINILGVSEMRWTQSGKTKIGDTTLVYSGPKKDHVRGVGLLLDSQTANSLMGYWAISDRVILVKLRGKPFNIAIVQVYAPTSSSTEEELDDFYDDLYRAFIQCKSQEVILVMGDINAKVGKGRQQDIVGPHGLGRRNERGDTWVQWCEQNDQIITNTWFEHNPRRLWTWRSPDDNTKNQIDYITINRRFRNSILNVKGYPGADCNTDHVLLVATLRLKLKKILKTKQPPKLDLEMLRKDDTLRRQYQTTVRASLDKNDSEDINSSLNTEFNGLAQALKEAAEKVIPIVPRVANQDWMTPEILKLMEERRKLKRRSPEYRRLDRTIRNKCQEEKDKFYSQQCKEIELLERKNPQRMHDKVRQVVWRQKSGTSSCIEAKDGTIIMEKEEIIKRWQEYIGELFADDRGTRPCIRSGGGCMILKDEVERAIRSLSRGKATGPDGIAVEMIEALADFGIERITKLANRIYNEGHFPTEMCKSVFITLQKRSGATKCEEHRTISLMSHLTKLVLRILLNRIRGRTTGEVSEEQYGFTPDKGTRNAIFILRMLAERAIEMQRDVYVCFIDYVKAFDKVRHEPLIEMLEALNIDGKDIELVMNLYWDQQAAVRIDGVLSEYVNIERGVRQGCIMSPDLFSLYTEMIMRHIKDLKGFNIGGVNINNLRYADDTVLIADTEENLQNMMNKTVEESEGKGLTINRRKSFVMVFSKKPVTPVCIVKVKEDALEQVNQFQYLGSMVTSTGKCDTEIRRRIGIAKTAYNKMKGVLNSRSISITTRLRLLKCYVWSVLLYGCEGWTISQTMQARLEATEMWFLRRMMRIPWTKKVRNDTVLQRAGTTRELMRTIVTRQVRFLGHVLRKGQLEHLVLTGKVEGRRARGRQRMTYLQWLSSVTNRSTLDIIRKCIERCEHVIVADVRL